jgi:uncharacterized tellurite resistance protein B-like protein
MFRNFRELFDSFIDPAPAQSEAERQHALQLATAVLLIEVMRADPHIDAAENTTVVDALRAKFDLTPDEVTTLVARAGDAARDAYDTQRFTAQLNRAFDLDSKVRVIEFMWQVAYADGRLHAREEHLMRKVADLLYIPHADYITAKLRARDAGPAAAA